ncbi:MAG TPA: hypothetical protein VJA21_00220 [Verrucomicrobiae bacterium]
MSDIVPENASVYAARYQLRLGKSLGSGIDGTVLVAENKIKHTRSAIKALKLLAPYVRERNVYVRLREAGITQVLGFHVPQLIWSDDDLRVIEMTIVVRPFVLDFAGARLDAPPSFSDETWAEWEAEKREQFGARWETVRAVMDVFEALHIYLVDVSPGNIGFREP